MALARKNSLREERKLEKLERLGVGRKTNGPKGMRQITKQIKGNRGDDFRARCRRIRCVLLSSICTFNGFVLQIVRFQLKWMNPTPRCWEVTHVFLLLFRIPHDAQVAEHLPRVVPPHRGRHYHRLPPHPHQRAGGRINFRINTCLPFFAFFGVRISEH